MDARVFFSFLVRRIPLGHGHGHGRRRLKFPDLMGAVGSAFTWHGEQPIYSRSGGPIGDIVRRNWCAAVSSASVSSGPGIDDGRLERWRENAICCSGDKKRYRYLT